MIGKTPKSGRGFGQWNKNPELPVESSAAVNGKRSSAVAQKRPLARRDRFLAELAESRRSTALTDSPDYKAASAPSINEF